MKTSVRIPKIPEEEKSPIVSQLLEIIEEQFVTVQQQAELIQYLKDEIARLKGQKPKPKIRPSQLEKPKKKKSSSGKRPGSFKRIKTPDIVIHEEIPVPPEFIPPGSTFKEYQKYTVQGIKITPHNIRYLLERWETPDGDYIVGQLPPHVQGHYSFELKGHILYQYHQCHVTQPLLLEQLWEWGVDISSGQLNRILTEDKDIFHKEKDAILSVGLKVSDYINVDDTGARHAGKNGYCAHIGNEFFGILHIGAKVVYTFGRGFSEQTYRVDQSALFLCGYFKENYLLEAKEQGSFSSTTSKRSSIQSFFCFLPVNISIGVWSFLLPSL
jgi:hypothetical protein